MSAVVYVNGVPNVADFATSRTNPPVVVDRLTGDVYCLKAGAPYKSTGGGASGPAAIGDVTGLQAALDAKSASNHNHDGEYATVDHNHDAAYAAADHTHPGGGSALDAWPVGSVYIAVDSTSPATRFGGGTWAAFGAGKVLVGIDVGGDADFDTAEETGGAKTKAISAHAGTAVSAHAGTAVADHASHTHTYTEIVQHTHPATDAGHTHTIPVGATDDTSAPFDRADAGTNTGGANATTATGSGTASVTTSNPVGSVATGTTNGPGAALTHSVTQPSNHTVTQPNAHTDLNVVQPYIVVYMWKRTA